MSFMTLLFLLLATTGFAQSAGERTKTTTSVPTPAPYPISYLKRHGIFAYNDHDMDKFFDSTPIYLRDIMSDGFVSFDLPSNSVGFYPVSPMKLEHPHNHIEVNATNSLHVSFFKCGFVMGLGKVFRGRVMYDNKDVKALQSVDCGANRKNHHVKLMIRTMNRRSKGWIKLEREDKEEGFMDHLPTILLSVGVISVLIGFCTCVCRCKCRKHKKVETDDEKWKIVDSFHYFNTAHKPCPDDLYGTGTTASTIVYPYQHNLPVADIRPLRCPRSVSTFCSPVRRTAAEILDRATLV